MSRYENQQWKFANTSSIYLSATSHFEKQTKPLAKNLNPLPINRLTFFLHRTASRRQNKRRAKIRFQSAATLLSLYICLSLSHSWSLSFNSLSKQRPQHSPAVGIAQPLHYPVCLSGEDGARTSCILPLDFSMSASRRRICGFREIGKCRENRFVMLREFLKMRRSFFFGGCVHMDMYIYLYIWYSCFVEAIFEGITADCAL